MGVVGFVGLGDMGAGIAANYARSGLDLLAHDLRAELEPEVRGWGGDWAASTDELLGRSRILCVCLVDDRQLRGFVDQAQVFAGLAPGSTLVVHSTVSPELMGQLADEAAGQGVEVVDAPISGSHARAVAGTLSVMVGATATTFERLRPLWDAMSAHAYRISDTPGSGQVVKLCNNMMTIANNLVALEAITIAESYGVEESAFLDVVRTSSGSSWIVEHWGTIDTLLMTHPQAGRGADFHLLVKDIRDAVRIGAERGRAPEIAGAATSAAPRVFGERLDDLRKAASAGRPA
ncbi:NAD(P)-dependent oxidoreductase [Pseudonocardia ailaonensis]|uniref:NAD(P)-dependent oxidoreductase n=1 Tax=Pseudonocardia ailaonensis TaxID=367279 RepID=UPI0031E29968